MPGVGYLPPLAGVKPYNKAYFDRYAAQADTDIGRKLMAFRVEFAAHLSRGELVDIGIGSGAFVEARLKAGFDATFGYDVNPAGKDWLQTRGLWCDVYRSQVDSISCWDVLEHIPNFAPLLRQVRKYVFVSIPIFRSVNHVFLSKHYRPDEHCWYFTREGLISAFHLHGFFLVNESREETKIGREDIGTFAFKRRD
jgi:hypothetical protein